MSSKCDFKKILIKDARRFPVRIIDFSNKSDKTRHDQVVKLVEQMQGTPEQEVAVAKTPQGKTNLERQIAATDTQIDRLVYDLYALTADEIQLVEGDPLSAL